MNERIEELAVKSGFELEDGGHLMLHHLYVTNRLEKFAELIVRDCASICDQQGRVGWNDDRKAQARLDRDLIKEHFGVE